MKKSTSFHLSDEALELLSVLSGQLGISQAGVVEIAIRKLARLEGVGRPGVTAMGPAQSVLQAAAIEAPFTVPTTVGEVQPKTAKDIRVIPVTVKAKAKGASAGK
jgi:hypothetical protein